MIVTAGKTNVTVYFYIVQDASNSAPGEPVTGLLFSDIETGGSASYMRQGAARTDFTLVTLGSSSVAHADGGFILVDDTNMPGLYRCDVPDAAFATGVDQVVIQLVVEATNNAVVAPLQIDLTDVDFRDSVRGGMTALPNAAADAAGGLTISDAGALDLDAMNVNINDIETDTAAMQPLVAKIPLSDGVITWNATALASINAEADTAISDAALSTAANLAIVDTNVDDIETAVITNAAGVDIAADIIAIKAETVLIVADTNELQTDDVPGLIAALNDPTVAAIADGVLDEDMTAHQTTGTLGQAIGDPVANTKTLYAALITDAAGASVTADVATVDTVVDGIQTDLDNGTDGLGAIKTDTAAILVDTGTTIPSTITTLQSDTDDIQTRLPAALVGGRMDADMGAISTSTVAADNLEATAEVILIGSATGVTLSITQMSADGFTEATDDHFNGKVITWSSGALLKQSTDITAYDGATQTFTFTAITEAPADNDTFTIT